jgi:hypothetical protein
VSPGIPLPGPAPSGFDYLSRCFRPASPPPAPLKPCLAFSILATLVGFRASAVSPAKRCRLFPDRHSLMPLSGLHGFPPGGVGFRHRRPSAPLAFPMPSAPFTSQGPLFRRTRSRHDLRSAPGFWAACAILCHTSGYFTLQQARSALALLLLRPSPLPALPGSSAILPLWGF